jgi:spastin
MLAKCKNELSEDDLVRVVGWTDGYSCADIVSVCREAAMVPLRGLQLGDGEVNEIRPMSLGDIELAVKRIKASVSPESVEKYLEWDREFGYASL